MYLNDTCLTRRRLIKWSTNSWTIQNYSLFVFGKTSNSETFTFCPILFLKKCVPVSIWPSTISVQDTRAFYTLKGEWWLKGFHGSWSQESEDFSPRLKNAFAIAFAHVKRIHCVYDLPPRIPIEFLHFVRPRKRHSPVHIAFCRENFRWLATCIYNRTFRECSRNRNGEWIEIFEYCIGNPSDFVNDKVWWLVYIWVICFVPLIWKERKYCIIIYN